MATDIPNYEAEFREAVVRFWAVREEQAERQKSGGGVQDAGSRSYVTAGKHLRPLEDVVRTVLHDAGVSDGSIYTGFDSTLPGFYRETKNWDMVVLHKKIVVATLELKSQVGSFGNNQNNRIEEAIGQAVDFWEAAEEGLMPGIRPWFGYVMLVEDHPRSTKPVRGRKTLLPCDRAFENRSYVDRYALAFSRLYATKKLDAYCFAHSERGG